MQESTVEAIAKGIPFDAKPGDEGVAVVVVGIVTEGRNADESFEGIFDGDLGFVLAIGGKLGALAELFDVDAVLLLKRQKVAGVYHQRHPGAALTHAERRTEFVPGIGQQALELHYIHLTVQGLKFKVWVYRALIYVF